ncbi:hypothetical protein COV11_02400 [Candidatus Woesearchaeota archaeon CG10_big_fil_rev_8_21_14_0_10_30_7]|nr:MAG: hypothetical protein COV11_02400 [Candidatus Woesearchaeota archaeon CG10_big_fil_rev_8_21_14_0_10_30_7]
MNLTKLGWHLGLTKRWKTELSDLITEEGTVTWKHYVEARSDATSLPAGDWDIRGELHYYITLEGKTVQFHLDSPSVYKQFEEGDKVKINYQKAHLLTLNYVAPNFDNKVEVKRRKLKDKFVTAEKI